MSELREMIGTRIRAMRNAKGLTQQKLADIAGLDYRYIGALERGERNFSIDTLEKVLVALDVSLTELTYADDKFNNKDVSEHREVTDEFIMIVNTLTQNQIHILRRMIKEVEQAFHSISESE